MHRIIRNDGITNEEALEFANIMLEVLSDTASHITQTRIDNMFGAIRLRGAAPRLANTATPFLLDAKALAN